MALSLVVGHLRERFEVGPGVGAPPVVCGVSYSVTLLRIANACSPASA